MIIESKQITPTLVKAIFEMQRDGITKEIENYHLNTQALLTIRAKAEFLKFGKVQTVEFNTYFNDLSINDIIDVYAPYQGIPTHLTNTRFIIQEITHTKKDGEFISTIKAIRYD